jgi:hypothetical protein
MTRLGRASALLAVFAGDYAILMLINDQPTDFDVSAIVCAVALLGIALFEYVVRLSLSLPLQGSIRPPLLMSRALMVDVRPTDQPANRPNDRRRMP